MDEGGVNCDDGGRAPEAVDLSHADTLRSNIGRAERFAAAMTNDVERNRFEVMAAELRRELNAVQSAPLFGGGKGDGDV
jgi:hypothetical protein